MNDKRIIVAASLSANALHDPSYRRKWLKLDELRILHQTKDKLKSLLKLKFQILQ